MAVKLGAGNISKLYLGATEINKAYLGATLVYDAAPAPAFLLDTYTGAAAAYSLRKLKTGVTSVVRVRRSSDNVEADFTALEITDGTLTTWTGANDGFVVSLYDQSGNNVTLTQSVAANQRQLVTGGSLNLKNGKPALTGVDKWLDNYSPGSTTVYSIFAVFSPPATINTGWSFIYFNGNNNRIGGNQNGSKRGIFRAGFSYNPIFDSGYAGRDGLQTFITHIRPNSTTGSMFTNGAANASNPVTTGSGEARDEHQVGLNALDFQEVIEWSIDQTANRADIETAINAHYGIY